MKKWLLGFGSLGAIVAPIATVVACDDEDKDDTTTNATSTSPNSNLSYGPIVSLSGIQDDEAEWNKVFGTTTNPLVPAIGTDLRIVLRGGQIIASTTWTLDDNDAPEVKNYLATGDRQEIATYISNEMIKDTPEPLTIQEVRGQFLTMAPVSWEPKNVAVVATFNFSTVTEDEFNSVWKSEALIPVGDPGNLKHYQLGPNTLPVGGTELAVDVNGNTYSVVWTDIMAADNTPAMYASDNPSAPGSSNTHMFSRVADLIASKNGFDATAIYTAIYNSIKDFDWLDGTNDPSDIITASPEFGMFPATMPIVPGPGQTWADVGLPDPNATP